MLKLRYRYLSLIYIFYLLFFIQQTAYSEEISASSTSYSGGAGTELDPYLIEDAYDLITLSNTSADWDKHFYQTDDVLFTDPSELGPNQELWLDSNGDNLVDYDEIDFNMDGNFTNDTNGFNPIGTTASAFGGSYAGWDNVSGTYHSYKIENLYINRPTQSSIGLFRKGQTGITIRNINFINGYVVGKDYVGMCCGQGLIHLIEIETSGFVEGTKRVGGVIGNIDGSGGSIEECGNSATVVCYGTGTYDGNHSGGVIGYASCSIERSYNRGYVYSTGGTSTGGVVGSVKSLTSSANALLTNSYSSGAVIGATNVGGVVGSNSDRVVDVYTSGYVHGNSANTGAIIGEHKNSNGEVDGAIYDPLLVLLDDAIGIVKNSAPVGTLTALNTSDYTDQNSFPFDFGSSEASPWIINTNQYGRPYLYWQEVAVSNPFPEYQSVGFEAIATYLGSLEPLDPATPEVTNRGVRVTKLDGDNKSSWDDEEWQWYHIYTDDVTSSTFSTIKDNIFDNRDQFLIQPFVVDERGVEIYGDMTKMEARYFLALLTHNDSDRLVTSTTMNGEIYKGTGVTEYGFIYSKDITDMTLDDVSGTNPVVEQSSVTPSSPIDCSPDAPFTYSVTLSSDALIKRKNYYMRSYAKDEAGDIEYGDVRRFITEERDFSLHLDGESLLMIDASSTDVINSWGDDGDHKFSIDFWIKREGELLNKQVLLSNENSTSGYTLSLGVDGKISLESPTSATVSSSGVIDDERWHHIALVYTMSNVTLSINGEETTHTATLTKPSSLSTNFTIGAQVNGVISNAFSGKIDALRFWSVALSSDNVEQLAYDNIVASSNNKVRLKGSGEEIDDLMWDNLTAAIGFNVKSTLETPSSTIPISYQDESEGVDYPFFIEEGRGQFNIIAIGTPLPSVSIPRSNWSYMAPSSEWSNESSWSSYAYPGKGISSSELSFYEDVTDSVIDDSGDYCEYTVINKVSNNIYYKPIVSTTPPFLNYLVDREKEILSYRVDDSSSATLLIKSAITSKLFSNNPSVINSSSSYIRVESGSVESNY